MLQEQDDNSPGPVQNKRSVTMKGISKKAIYGIVCIVVLIIVVIFCAINVIMASKQNSKNKNCLTFYLKHDIIISKLKRRQNIGKFKLCR